MRALLPGSGRVDDSERNRETILRTIGVVAGFFYLYSGFFEKDWSMWAVLLIAVVFLGLGFLKP
jgi:dolichol kinase